MKKKIYIVMLVLFIFLWVHTTLFIFEDNNDKILFPFTTDWCSSFPDGTIFNPDVWRECCVNHDKEYWKGWTKIEKNIADQILWKCVSSKGYPILWFLMKYWVKIWGSAYFPTSFRWWYGWSQFKGYEKLSISEIQQIKE